MDWFKRQSTLVKIIMVGVVAPMFFLCTCMTGLAVIIPKGEVPSPESSAKLEGISEDRILFRASPPGRYVLYTVNVDGTKLTKLLDIDRTDWWYVSSILSPHRNRVAFFSSDSYLSVLRIDNGGVTKLIEARQEDSEGYIAWSPDGSKIAYASNRDLYVVNADGSDNKKLAEHHSGKYSGRIIEDQIRCPIWSADGNQVLFDDFRAPFFFTGSPLDPGPRSIYAVNITTTKKKDLVSGARLEDQTSDRTKILIKTGPLVWSVMNIDGSGEKETLKLPWVPDKCKCSPDGSMIACAGVERDRELWIIDAITGERIPVVDEVKSVRDVVWSPDGQYIAYVSPYVPRDEIHVVRRDLSHGFLVYPGLGPREGEERLNNIELISWLSQE